MSGEAPALRNGDRRQELEAAALLDPRAAGARRLADKICIVTGAGQGIGRATARRFGAEGGTVVVAERVEASARETLRQLQEAGVEAMLALSTGFCADYAEQ